MKKYAQLILLLLPATAFGEIIEDADTIRQIMSEYPACSGDTYFNVEVDEYCPEITEIIISELEQNNPNGLSSVCPPTTRLRIACPVIRLNEDLSVNVGDRFWFSEREQCWSLYQEPVVRCETEIWSDKVEAMLWDHFIGVDVLREKLCDAVPEACDPMSPPLPVPLPPLPRDIK